MGGIEVVDAEQFYTSTEGAQFYGVNAHALAPRARVGALSADAVVLLAEDTSYADVFDARAAGMLPEHHPMEHKIDMQPGKEPP